MADMDLAEKLKQFTSSWVQATKEPFTNHPTANFLRNDLKTQIAAIVKDFDDSYLINASAGAGNWANVPWLSILNPEITTRTQYGIYPVYLFRADGLGFYLSLNQGTAEPKKRLGKVEADKRAQLIKKYLLSKFPELKDWGEQTIDLNADTSLGKSYETVSITAKYYSIDTELDSESIKQDLLELLTIYKKIVVLDIDKELQQFTGINTSKNIKPINSKKPLPANLTPLSKPFLLLAGISGTGKTRFVREQAKMTGSLSDNYCLTSVRPDWHEPSDILGHISRLGSQGAEYVTTEVLQFMAKAWRAIIDADLELQIIDDRLMVSGDQAQLNNVLPYWLCLDEMNLAPVEQYFADYLSVLETREWCWDAEQFYYCCDPLLKSATIAQLSDQAKTSLRKTLGFEAEGYDNAWDLFCTHGLSLPFNLVVAGTVNMDETTHGFSRKVIDRALSFDFGEFFPNDFAHFFAPTVQHKALSYPLYSQASLNNLPAIDSTGERSIGFLQSINSVLDNSPFKLAFRALNELLLTVITSQPSDAIQLQAVWDDFLMHKVLPRIDGDYDKLAAIDRADSSNEQSLLTELAIVLEQQLADIWPNENTTDKLRPDLYRENLDGSTLYVTCRSKTKLAWMQERLQRSGFTSFWP
ncbi:MrcB family domain-containing protein [Psychrobacter sp. 1Y11]|uniref:MrcB family domain-containing protein n=1 Tax=Psychrobacter sp. 1Y11 TaxID=3457446 RepID=UPI003FD666DA